MATGRSMYCAWAAGAVRPEHQAPRHRVGGGLAAVVGNHMQTEVHARGGPGRGQDIALVDVKHRGIDLHLRVTLGKARRTFPMGRGASAVEQPGCRQHERPAANRSDSAATGVGPLKILEQTLGRRSLVVHHTGHDDGLCLFQQPPVPLHLDDDRRVGDGRAGRALKGRHPVAVTPDKPQRR